MSGPSDAFLLRIARSIVSQMEGTWVSDDEWLSLHARLAQTERVVQSAKEFRRRFRYADHTWGDMRQVCEHLAMSVDLLEESESNTTTSSSPSAKEGHS